MLYIEGTLSQLVQADQEAAVFVCLWRMKHVLDNYLSGREQLVEKVVMHLVDNTADPLVAPLVLDVLQTMIRLQLFDPDASLVSDIPQHRTILEYALTHGTPLMAGLVASLLNSRCIRR